MKLRNLGGRAYATPDGRYLIERQDGETECAHPLCDTLHRKWHTRTGDGRGSMHWIDYASWHVWDDQRHDYADTTNSRDFDTRREAVEWLEAFITNGRGDKT